MTVTVTRSGIPTRAPQSGPATAATCHGVRSASSTGAGGTGPRLSTQPWTSGTWPTTWDSSSTWSATNTRCELLAQAG